MGSLLVSWVLAPAMMLAVFGGCGLFLRRLSGASLPAVYLLPLGFALVVVLTAFLTSFDATAELATVALVVVAVVGVVLERARLRAVVPAATTSLAPVAAAFAAFAVVAAPLILSGETSWTGYGRIVDIAHQFDFSAYISKHGRAMPGAPDSAFEEVAGKTLAVGYPSGSQSPLGALARLVGRDLAWIYQPYLAVVTAISALALYCLLRRLIPSPPLLACAAAVAAQPNVLYGYTLAGGIKELTAAALLVLTAALAGEAVEARLRPRQLVPLAIAISASLAAFNLTIVPWLGIVLLGFLVLSLWKARERRRVAYGWSALAAITLLVSLPTVAAAVKLAPVAAAAEGSNRTFVADLGNLAAPMPVRAAAGVWLTGDYRFPDRVGPINDVLIVVVLLLAVAGLAVALRRRSWSVALLVAASGVALMYFFERTGPWLQLKAIAVTSPIVLACAFVGAAAVIATRARPLGWLLAAVVGVTVLAGNALAYHSATVAPEDRLRDLEAIGKRLPAEGPTLYPAFEEYAEYFLRRQDALSIVNAPAKVGLHVRPEVLARRPGLQFIWDVDELVPEYLERFRFVVRRRGPAWSRPPTNWRLLERTRFHEVWEKRRGAGAALLHEPLPAYDRRACDRFVAAARRAPAGTRIAYTTTPEMARLPLGLTNRPAHWKPANADSLLVSGPGLARGVVRVRTRGSYAVWIQGPFGRRTTIAIDGKRVGSLKNRHNYPGQYELVGRRRLRAGRHVVELSRGGGNLEPGNASGDYPIGPVMLTRLGDTAGRVRTTGRNRASALCGMRGRLDWVELRRR